MTQSAQTCPWCYGAVRAGVDGLDRLGRPALWHAKCAWRAQTTALRARKGQPGVVPAHAAREGRADFVAAAAAGPRERPPPDEVEPEDPVTRTDTSMPRLLRDRHRRLNAKERALALAAVLRADSAKVVAERDSLRDIAHKLAEAGEVMRLRPYVLGPTSSAWDQVIAEWTRIEQGLRND